jgi:hypothetical protein
MSKLVLSGDTSGSVTLDAPAVSGTTTLTLPTTSGTVITTGSTFAGTGPAFLAFTPGGQSIANNTNVKLTFSNDSTSGAFDTNNCYDTTNHRFLPTVAGYYQISAILASTTATGLVQIGLFKTGSQYAVALTNANSNGTAPAISLLIYFNGSTNYVECYMYQNSGSTYTTLSSRNDLYQFSGAMVRSA